MTNNRGLNTESLCDRARARQLSMKKKHFKLNFQDFSTLAVETQPRTPLT